MNLKNINIAIVGFGNIGSFFYQTVEKNKKKIQLLTGRIPTVKFISAKNLNKKRKIKIPNSKKFKNPLKLLPHMRPKPNNQKITTDTPKSAAFFNATLMLFLCRDNPLSIHINPACMINTKIAEFIITQILNS